MLCDFKTDQLLAYNLLTRDIENNCITHAYLIDENNYYKSYDMVLSFVKEIICRGVSDEERINIIKRIDDCNYPEIKIIKADGMYIKKQQIIDLQQEFSRVAVEGKKRIYIIRDCEKMRAESANAMLKFLEEPENDIVAILMTNNINNVLTTIISRCKIIKLNNILNVDEKDIEMEDFAKDFIYNLEKKGIDFILDIKDFWFSKIVAKDRERMLLLFDIIIDMYYDILSICVGKENVKYFKYKDFFKELLKNNTMSSLLKKIDILIEAKDSIKFNVNSSLLMDSIIVSIGGMFE